MAFKVAKPITSELFEHIPPVNVFFKEIEKSDYKPEEKYKNKHILFRKKFAIDNTDNTKIKITADDYYKLYINGQFVIQGPAPSYNFAYYYNEIDIVDFLIKGENTIAVHTYYQGLVNRVWVSGDRRHMLICEVENAGQIVACTDESWKTATHTAYYICGKNYGYDTGFCEGYDANALEVGFELSDYDDSGWQSARVKQHCYYKFVPQPTIQLDIYEITPYDITKNADGYFIDIGREIVGYLSFTARGNKGDKVIIKSGEELNDDGTVRYDMRCHCIYKEEFILADGESNYRQYDYKAFRYIQIDVPETAELLPKSITITVRHYPYEQVIDCPYDDKDVRAVWTLCADTIKYGMQEVLVDCPTREKGQYLGDGTITSIAHVLLIGDTTFMKKTLTDFANSTFISKSIMTVAPASLMQEIADYSLQFPLQVLWLYNATSDIDFLRKMQWHVKNIVEDFEQYARADGLLEKIADKWNLVDWPVSVRDNYDFELVKPIGSGVISVINAYYYGAVCAYEQINKILGIPYSSPKEKLRTAFISAFYDEQTHLFTDSELSSHSSIHANILPLLFNIKPEDNDYMADFISKRGIHRCGVYMAMFFLMALKNHRGVESILPHITDTNTWIKMLSQGATTCYEVWDKEDKINTSLFHPWATAPIIALSDTKFPY